MFPNVRLMIAATLASVVALICGFGMFAAFQVSHDPLVRLPSASAPLQLSADNAATPMAYAAAEPFARRFQISEARNAAEAIDALARKIDHREGIQSAPSPAPAPSAAEVKDTAAVEAPKEIAPSPVAQPTEKPSEKTAAPAADDHVPSASAPQPAPGVAAVEPPAEQSLPEEQVKPGNKAAPASVTKSVTDAEKTDTAAVRKTRHGHAARTHRPSKAPSAVAQSSTYQDSATSQPNFRTAPQSQQPQERPARIHHAKVASRKTKEPSSATGGPLVSAPSQ
jgi:hypothetical protein